MGKNAKVGLAAIAALVCGALAAPQALAVDKIESHIGISERFPAFHGDVDAEENECVPHRTVKLYREKNGPDKFLGQDGTSATGEWAITEASHGFILKSGVYYAKVSASIAGDGDRCTKDRSRTVFVD